MTAICGLAWACCVAWAADAPDYIVARDAAARLDGEPALAALLQLAAGPLSTAQKADALEQASMAALRLHRDEQALELAKKIPTPSISTAAQMRVLVARRQWRTVVEQFGGEDIDAWWPDYVAGEAFFCRGRALAIAGDGPRAVADLRKAADAILYDDNSKGLALIALGNAYRDLLKDDAQALAAYRRTYTVNAPAKHCEAAMAAAGILARQNKLDAALAELYTVDLAKLIFLASTWENWATQGPAYYVMAQIAWNPELDAQAMLEDYYRRGFGPAAEAIKSYWTLMEKAYHQRAAQDLPAAEVYDAALFKKSQGILNRADAALGVKRDTLRKRVALVRAGLEYTRLLTEIETLMEHVKKSKRTDAETAAKVRADWDKIDQICRENRTTINRAYFRRDGLPMRSLNPDYLEKK